MYRNTASRCWLRAFRLIFQLPLRNADTHLRWLNDGRVAIELSVSHVLYLCQSNEILSGARLSNKVTQAVLTSLLSERESLSVLLMFATLWTPCSAIRGYLLRLVVHCQPKYWNFPTKANKGWIQFPCFHGAALDGEWQFIQVNSKCLTKSLAAPPTTAPFFLRHGNIKPGYSIVEGAACNGCNTPNIKEACYNLVPVGYESHSRVNGCQFNKSLNETPCPVRVLSVSINR